MRVTIGGREYEDQQKASDDLDLPVGDVLDYQRCLERIDPDDLSGFIKVILAFYCRPYVAEIVPGSSARSQVKLVLDARLNRVGASVRFKTDNDDVTVLRTMLSQLSRNLITKQTDDGLLVLRYK